ncbi:MAG TPA: cobalamin-independent methionine synthase II family protein [Armatimonadota bacterium]|nr:cobalamin-independent methionine synthase II family protein [Armatimonadota bacterium]
MSSTPLPLFPTTMVGSWPRPAPLLRARRQRARGEIPASELAQIEDEAVLDVLRIQEEIGLDIVTDGEQRRDNFYSFAAERLEGVRLMSLQEMLDVVEDRAGFERLLQTLDVPAFSIYNPTCVGPLRRRAPMAAGECRFLRSHTDRPIKIPLPGPYLLTRAMWVKELARDVYPTKEDLAEDVVAILREEIADVQAAGANFVQLDEPVLTEVALNPGGTRTFMCAALAARADPAEELEWAVSLINRVVEGVEGIRTGVHVCRGNWSRDESTLLQGSYNPLAPYLARLNVDQLVLEFATPRAGELESLLRDDRIAKEKELGLGVLNPRTERVEDVEEIEKRVEEALRIVAPNRIFLNPDCGFGTFSSRPMNEIAAAVAKLNAMVDAANALRERHSRGLRGETL